MAVRNLNPTRKVDFMASGRFFPVLPNPARCRCHALARAGARTPQLARLFLAPSPSPPPSTHDQNHCRPRYQRANRHGRPQCFAGAGHEHRLPIHPQPAAAESARREARVDLARQGPLVVVGFDGKVHGVQYAFGPNGNPPKSPDSGGNQGFLVDSVNPCG